MSQPHIIEEQTITSADLKAVLDTIQTRDAELSFRAGKTVDHLNHLTLIGVKEKDALVAAIDALGVPRLKLAHIHKIIDIAPSNIKELNLILSGYTLTVNKEYQQKIMDALSA